MVVKGGHYLDNQDNNQVFNLVELDTEVTTTFDFSLSSFHFIENSMFKYCEELKYTATKANQLPLLWESTTLHLLLTPDYRQLPYKLHVRILNHLTY